MFLLKIKIKQNPGCLNKDSIPEVKKYVLNNDYENIIAYSEESEQSEIRRTSAVSSKYI